MFVRWLVGCLSGHLDIKGHMTLGHFDINLNFRLARGAPAMLPTTSSLGFSKPRLTKMMRMEAPFLLHPRLTIPH